MIENWIDQIIKEGYRKGTFDNLSYQGQPIDNSDYFNAPAEDRLAYHILKNNNFYPEEVRLNKEIQELKVKISEASDPKEAEELKQELGKLQSIYQQKLESRKR